MPVTRLQRKAFLSTPAAIGLALVVAAQSVAASWSLPTDVAARSNTHAFPFGLTTPSGSTAVVIFVACGEAQICYSVETRRTDDGGATWDPPIVLAEGAYFASIGGRGSRVGAAWVDNGQVRFARSTDGGQSFADSKLIANADRAGQTSVAYGPDGLVVVSWVQNSSTGKLRARVSTDGGFSFGPAQFIASGTEEGVHPAAVGDGVGYVLYLKDGVLYVRRTLNSGASWLPPQQISDEISGNTFEQFHITAEGGEAYVAYLHESGAIHYRGTSNDGATWSAERQLRRSNRFNSTPRLSLEGGVLRAVFNTNNGLFYRQSADGMAWTPLESVSEIGGDGWVGLAGRPLVVYRVAVNPDRIEVRSRYRAP